MPGHQALLANSSASSVQGHRGNARADAAPVKLADGHRIRNVFGFFSPNKNIRKVRILTKYLRGNALALSQRKVQMRIPKPWWGK